MYYLKVCLNPSLYFLTHQEWRQAIKRLIEMVEKMLLKSDRVDLVTTHVGLHQSMEYLQGNGLSDEETRLII